MAQQSNYQCCERKHVIQMNVIQTDEVQAASLTPSFQDMKSYSNSSMFLYLSWTTFPSKKHLKNA